MMQALAKLGPKHESNAHLQYAVYIYHEPENHINGQNDWEMRTITSDLDTAIFEATTLFNSQSYRKVEVKKRTTDLELDIIKDCTLKIFDKNEDQNTANIIIGCTIALTSALAISTLIWSMF